MPPPPRPGLVRPLRFSAPWNLFSLRVFWGAHYVCSLSQYNHSGGPESWSWGSTKGGVVMMNKKSLLLICSSGEQISIPITEFNFSFWWKKYSTLFAKQFLITKPGRTPQKSCNDWVLWSDITISKSKNMKNKRKKSGGHAPSCDHVFRRTTII